MLTISKSLLNCASRSFITLQSEIFDGDCFRMNLPRQLNIPHILILTYLSDTESNFSKIKSPTKKSKQKKLQPKRSLRSKPKPSLRKIMNLVLKLTENRPKIRYLLKTKRLNLNLLVV